MRRGIYNDDAVRLSHAYGYNDGAWWVCRVLSAQGVSDRLDHRYAGSGELLRRCWDNGVQWAGKKEEAGKSCTILQV